MTTWTGYSMGSPEFNASEFADASAIEDASNYSLGDNGVVGAITLPFNFTIYSTTSNQLRVGANGVATIGAALPSNNNNAQSLPSSSAPGNAIMPFWDDLVIPFNGIWVAVEGESPNRRVVITWKDAQIKADPDHTQSFSAVLYEGTDKIEFHYAAPSVEDVGTEAVGSSATIGVQNINKTKALGYINSEFLPYDPSLFPVRIVFTPTNSAVTP